MVRSRFASSVAWLSSSREGAVALAALARNVCIELMAGGYEDMFMCACVDGGLVTDRFCDYC